MSGYEKGKLEQSTIDNLLAEVLAGKSKSEVARKYNLDRSTIYHYLAKKTTGKIAKKALSPEIKNAIKEEVKDKTKTCYSIAKKYGVKLSTVMYYYYCGLRGKIKVKTYKDFLAEENKKRKEKGLYLFKPVIWNKRTKE